MTAEVDMATRLANGASALRELYPKDFCIEAEMLDEASVIIGAARGVTSYYESSPGCCPSVMLEGAIRKLSNLLTNTTKGYQCPLEKM